uniref:alpha/beta fold hydrolase n=1 Tax=Ningiella ruwaisensis TaxID=2364274 RepID=UPI00109F96A7|nr:alpha/beta hydrolase [Ningiella ruwaisensis]
MTKQVLTKIVQRHMDLNSTRLNYLCMQQGIAQKSKPLLILLHGFPENAWTWERYLLSLCDDYEVIALDLPGYNFSSGFMRDEQYNLHTLVETLAEATDALVEQYAPGTKAHLVAHDWGGVIAWPLAAFYGTKFACLTILNAAHPSTFTREMANNPKQQASSDYIADLISDHAFDVVSQDDFRMLKRLYGGWYSKLSEEQQSHFEAQWADKHSMQQAFNYYKNMPQLVTKRVKQNLTLKIPDIRIDIPTQVLWGMKDTAFVPEVLNGMEDWVKDLHLHRFKDADHWLHHQKSEAVMQYIRAFH